MAQAPAPVSPPSAPLSARSGSRVPALTGDALHKAVLESFDGAIPPVPLPLHYKLGLFLVALAMVLLPLVYVGLIGFAGYGVWYHATHNYDIASGLRGRTAGAAFLGGYLAPLVVGVILILFMIKPLFAPRPKHMDPRRLNPQAEPLLFAFVAKICDLVGAPRPREIHVDCEVNASASFRRGLLSFFGDDLVLTIGLPLAAGLNLRQFAGVLAHEFGHFAQGAGMRMTFVIRSVNGWFARVVYERDGWDEALTQYAHETDIRIGIFLHLSRVFVWLTRQVLKLLMYAGHALSCFMLRQMEYDADAYETHMSGSACYASTMRRVIEMSIAQQLAKGAIGKMWDEGRLIDDIPRLARNKVRKLPKEAEEHVRKELTEGQTAWHQTHPSGRDRVAAANRIGVKGIYFAADDARLRLGESLLAADLFRDFAGLSKTVSSDFYRAVLGPKVGRAQFVPVDDLLDREDADEAAAKAAARYLQGAPTLLRPLPLPARPPAPHAALASGVEELARLREELLRLAPAHRAAYRRYDEADTALSRCALALALCKAKLGFDPKDFKLKRAEAGAAVAERERAQREQFGAAAELGPFEALAGARLHAALGLLEDPEIAGRIPRAEALRAEAARGLPAYRQVAAAAPKALELNRTFQALSLLCQNLEGRERQQEFIAEVLASCRQLQRALREIQGCFDESPYPFDHAKKDMTLRTYLLPAVPGEEQLGDVLRAAQEFLEKLAGLYFRLLQGLVAAAEQAEAAAGLPPFPEVPEEPAAAE
ncbi:MAG: M48 family metalloprotease [Planctomycetota bacterium]|nr:M48 family metalloprotease [Planctomycetota bacterium]